MATKKTDTGLLTKEQQAHLMGRIQAATNYSAADRLKAKMAPKETAAVTKARAVILAHDAAVKAAHNKAGNEIGRAKLDAEQALLFGTPAEALKMVEALERKYGARVE